MHILRYFVVVGTALLGLLFLISANLAARGPLAVVTDFNGLPKPWHGPALPRIAETAIPATNIVTDMNSEAALTATTTSAKSVAPTAALRMFAMAHPGQAAPHFMSIRKNYVSRKHVSYDQPKQRYAWQNGSSGAFGSGR